jgi:hypothetical protein
MLLRALVVLIRSDWLSLQYRRQPVLPMCAICEWGRYWRVLRNKAPPGVLPPASAMSRFHRNTHPPTYTHTHTNTRPCLTRRP